MTRDRMIDDINDWINETRNAQQRKKIKEQAMQYILWNARTGLFWDGQGFNGLKIRDARLVDAIEKAAICYSYANVDSCLQDD